MLQLVLEEAHLMSFWYLRHNVIALGGSYQPTGSDVLSASCRTLCWRETSVFKAEPLTLESDALFSTCYIPSIMAAVIFNASYLLICVDWQLCVLSYTDSRQCALVAAHHVNSQLLYFCHSHCYDQNDATNICWASPQKWQCRLFGYSCQVKRSFTSLIVIPVF